MVLAICELLVPACFYSRAHGKKIIDRIHNTRSSGKRLRDDTDGSPCKKGRPKVSLLLSRYPPVRPHTVFADAATDERNTKAL